MFNKRGLGRIHRKENSFNQDQINLAPLLANQVSLIVQVNYIDLLKSWFHWNKATTLYRLWNNQSWFRQTSTPPPPLLLLTHQKSLRICTNLMGGPGRGWGGARPPAPPRGYATDRRPWIITQYACRGTHTLYLVEMVWFTNTEQKWCSGHHRLQRARNQSGMNHQPLKVTCIGSVLGFIAGDVWLLWLVHDWNIVEENETEASRRWGKIEETEARLDVGGNGKMRKCRRNEIGGNWWRNFMGSRRDETKARLDVIETETRQNPG